MAVRRYELYFQVLPISVYYIDIDEMNKTQGAKIDQRAFYTIYLNCYK